MSIHPTAIIDPRAELDDGVQVGPFCVIEGHVRVGAGCRLYQNVYLTGWTEIASHCTLHPGVIVGHQPQDVKGTDEPSYCRIGKGTVLREYVTVHRGSEPESETVVGEGCFLLAGSHVAHNCVLGDHVTLINAAQLAGHVHVGDHATISGGVLAHQFVRIGELAMIGGNARVSMDVVPFALVDVEGRIAGLNRIGLRRANMPREHIREIREMYRLLFGSNLPFREAVEQAVAIASTPPGSRLAAFLQAETKRDLAGKARPPLSTPDR